jgi:hypothetical protein
MSVTTSIQLGSFTIQHAGTYVIREGSDLVINTTIFESVFILRLRFVVDDSRRGQLSWRGENNELIVECWSWVDGITTTLHEPAFITNHGNHAYYIDIGHALLSATAHLTTIQILTKEISK